MQGRKRPALLEDLSTRSMSSVGGPQPPNIRHLLHSNNWLHHAALNEFVLLFSFCDEHGIVRGSSSGALSINEAGRGVYRVPVEPPVRLYDVARGQPHNCLEDCLASIFQSNLFLHTFQLECQGPLR